jgi:hypothetical protein
MDYRPQDSVRTLQVLLELTFDSLYLPMVVKLSA